MSPSTTLADVPGVDPCSDAWAAKCHAPLPMQETADMWGMAQRVGKVVEAHFKVGCIALSLSDEQLDRQQGQLRQGQRGFQLAQIIEQQV